MRIFPILVLWLFFLPVAAQQKTAFVSGQVVDEKQQPIPHVSVMVLGRTTGQLTNDSGFFRIKLTPSTAIALIFSHTGYQSFQQNFYLSNYEEERINIQLQLNGKTLQAITIGTNSERQELGLVKINPKNAILLPSTVGGIEGLIKTIVGSNNELTAQYNVRGGNYDENLIYVNDFEIYRPYLTRSGQQEGLSFINPEMAKQVNFYNGGFQAKYGDKISSVLDIQYKKPKSFGGSAYFGLLEQGLHLEGTTKKDRVTYLIGIRNKTNQNLLSSQETQGSYLPSAADLQTLVTYRLTNKWQLEMLANYSATFFTLIPQSEQKTSSVFSPLFSANLGLDILFNGQEKDRYTTSFIGVSALHQPNKKIQIKWMLSHFENKENENFDIGSSYLFGDRNFDQQSSTYGKIVNPLGAGYYQNYGRNKLTIGVWNAGVKGSIENRKHSIQFGNSIEQTTIHDKLFEWEYQDSAGYSLPVNTGNLSSFLNSAANLTIQKYSGYLQDNFSKINLTNTIAIQAGLRYHYNSLNKELLVSPRVQVSIKPNWKNDLVFKLAAGIYNQPPLYRELRRYDGTLNPSILAQKSFQIVAGADYNFAANNRPFRITTEAYYKNLWDVIPYDIDNLRIRYLGSNNAKAYAYGIETRLYGELIKDAESWLSIGLMHTKENIEGDHYFTYRNAAGENISAKTKDQTPVDSSRQDVGWVRRPTDRLITVGLFLQDYLATNKNIKVHLNTIYGSNMPFNIPNSTRYRNALIIDPYVRIDIGFSALLLGEKNSRRSHSPFKNVDNIWASVEIFNLIDRDNTISYQLIKDFSNTVYTLPNRLTPRRINFKLVTRF